jgi:cytochrome c oxidase subunit 4
MSHDQPHAAHAHHESHGSWSTYISVAAALLVLTFISFGVGSSQALTENAPLVKNAVMIAVSCIKAMLVILFFMHLKWEANWKYVLTVPASIMSMFLVLMLIPDVGLRARWYSEERKTFAVEPSTGHHAQEHGNAAEHGHAHDGHAHDESKPKTPAKQETK